MKKMKGYVCVSLLKTPKSIHVNFVCGKENKMKKGGVRGNDLYGRGIIKSSKYISWFSWKIADAQTTEIFTNNIVFSVPD